MKKTSFKQYLANTLTGKKWQEECFNEEKACLNVQTHKKDNTAVTKANKVTASRRN